MVDKLSKNLNLKLNALILGGSGAVGRILVKSLLNNNNYNKIVLITRKKLDEWDDKTKNKIENLNKLDILIVNNLDFLSENKENIAKTLNIKDFNYINTVFCCLGGDPTDEKSVKKIDYEHCLNSALLCEKFNIPNFSIISTKSANPKSYFSYLSYKGKLDEELLKLKIKNVSVFRPPLLEDRTNGRFLEKVLTYVPFYEKIKINDLISAVILDDEKRNKELINNINKQDDDNNNININLSNDEDNSSTSTNDNNSNSNKLKNINLDNNKGIKVIYEFKDIKELLKKTIK